MVNSKQKGARGERAWVAVLKEFGLEARRSQQFCGYVPDGQADVLCEGLSQYHFEVKHVQKLNIHEAMTQAVNDARASNKGQVPIVVHKKNGTQFLVTMLATDFLALALAALNKN